MIQNTFLIPRFEFHRLKFLIFYTFKVTFINLISKFSVFIPTSNYYSLFMHIIRSHML